MMETNKYAMEDGFEEWEKFISDNEDRFIITFIGDKFGGCMHITEISWCSHSMKFVWVTYDGQHIADSVEIKEWWNFIK